MLTIKCNTSKKILFSFLLVFAVASSSSATNGYFSHGFGVHSKGLAGAGVAMPYSSLSAATNPALMAQIGSRYDIDITLFNPNRQFTVNGNPSMAPGTFGLAPGTVESESKLFVIPSIGINWVLDDMSTFGVSIYGNGGMNTNYKAPVFGATPTGVDLAQLFASFTYARKLDSKHTVGGSLIVGYQRFKAEGFGAFGQMGFSADPNNLSENDYASSTGIGARVGYLGNWFEGFSFGASYQSKMSMSEFKEYAGLFAEQGDFDIPSNWTVGVAADISKTMTLLADVQTVYYSEVKAINNPLLPNIMNAQLGNESGAGFGWEDVTTYKFGLEWEGLADLPFRFGYSVCEQPIPESDMMFNIVAPGVIEQHLSFGFTKKCCNNRSFSMAITRGFSKTVEGPNSMEAPDVQTIELKMDQWDIVFGLSF